VFSGAIFFNRIFVLSLCVLVHGYVRFFLGLCHPLVSFSSEIFPKFCSGSVKIN
jgi:hypothetical protein